MPSMPIVAVGAEHVLDGFRAVMGVVDLVDLDHID